MEGLAMEYTDARLKGNKVKPTSAYSPSTLCVRLTRSQSPAMEFHSIDSHPFYIVPSASSFTHPRMSLSQNAQQQTPPSTAPVQDSNP
eukprot:8424800-Ditylum_brightwellii.AAC.1